MMQIKKWLISFGLLTALVLPIAANANETSLSDVADQKSVIDEQNLTAGSGFIIETDLEHIEQLLFEQERLDYYNELGEKERERLKELEEKRKKVFLEMIDNLTDEEKELICRITFREAGNQCEQGQRAVMEVILNRVKDSKFPNSVEGVLSAPGQFSTWKLRHKVTSEQIDNMMIILEMVHDEEPVLAGNYVYFDGVQHSYGKNYIKIQGHWFGTR